MQKLFCLAILLVSSSLLRAQESDSSASNYFIAPVTTELQQSLVRTGATVYAEVNANALIQDGMVDLEPLKQSAFLAELNKLAREGAMLNVVCRYHLSEKTIDRVLMSELESALVKYCEEAGFPKLRKDVVQTSSSWDEQIRNLNVIQESSDVTESLFENDIVMAYPVRTRLSKYLLGDIDCYVNILPSVDGRTTELPKAWKDAITQAVQSFELRHKHKLMFALGSTRTGEPLAERLFNAAKPPVPPKFEEGKPKPSKAIVDLLEQEYQSKLAAFQPSEALKLAKDLGFDTITYRHSPNGGDPETLVGQRVPDFMLEDLQGGELKLHDHIKGRPAIITFWGLACGPCRREAPHLTRLYNQYGSDKLSVIAVNAYNDTRADVQEYAKNDGIAHTIVLQGDQVAKNGFHVSAYPTTFWIDSKGIVIDYEVGFDSVPRLERKLEALISAKKSN